MAHKTAEVRFLAGFHVADSGCWVWQRSLHEGYGVFHGFGVRGAHRASWVRSHGPIPAGMSVLHRCDVRSCCNPDHLFLGTQADNMRDMVAKGRQATGDRTGARLYGYSAPVVPPENRPRGEANARSKFTEDQIRTVRRLMASGVSGYRAAKIVGMSGNNARWIASGKGWAHVR